MSDDGDGRHPEGLAAQNAALSAVLEVGTSRTTCWIGEQRADGIRILAAAEAPSEGVRVGEVVDVRAAAAPIRGAVDEAERQAGVDVEGLCVSLSGAGMTCTASRAAVPITREGGEVTRSEVRAVMGRAGDVAIPNGARMVHVLPQGFRIDGAGPVRDPVGLTGAILEAGVTTLAASVFAYENLARAVRTAGRHVTSVALAPAALGLGALSEEERRMGALAVDIGAGLTGFALWKCGVLAACGCVPVAGEMVTHDVAAGLGVTLDAAEDLKLCASASAAHRGGGPEDDANRVLRAPALGGGEAGPFTRSEVSEIVEARIEEILLLVKRRLGGAAPPAGCGAGVVLAGGGAHQKGLDEKANAMFHVRARRAGSDLRGDVPERFLGPAYAVLTGLLRWSFGTGLHEEAERSPRPVRWIASAFKWLAEGF